MISFFTDRRPGYSATRKPLFVVASKMLGWLLLFFGFAFGAQAHEVTYENSWIELEAGEKKVTALHYDAFEDVLTVKSNNEAQVYTASQVQRFFYNGYEYYSLPFNGGRSFFKVLHEGSNFAVLQKAAGISLLEHFVHSSKGRLQICEDPDREDGLLLCEGVASPYFGMPVHSGGEPQYRLDEGIFLALNGQLSLVSYQYETIGGYGNTTLSVKKKNKRTLKLLKAVVADKAKMLQLRDYVAQADRNLEDPDQLIGALQTIYQ